MSTSTAMLIGILPAALIVMAAVAVRHIGPAETAARRLLLLFEISTLVILAILAGMQILPPPARYQVPWIIPLFIPVIFGLIILILINLRLFVQLSKPDKVVVIFLGLVILGILGYHLREPSSLMMVLPAGVLMLGVTWLINKRPSRWIWVLPVISVAMLVLVNSPCIDRLVELPRILSSILGVVIFLTPAFVVAVMSLLVNLGLNLISPSTIKPEKGILPSGKWEGISHLVTAALLLGFLVYSTVWASVWDQTSDGMSGLLYTFIAIPVAVACGMVMGLRASGWRKLVGAAFALIVSFLVSTGFHWGWQISFPLITERRAAQVAAGLGRFYQRESQYPNDLSELVPRDLLFVPGPVMFRGETWCYQAEGDRYRLAAFFHEYFGLPVSLHVYASAGTLEGMLLPCQERLADMQSRYDWTHGEPMINKESTQPHIPAPLPDGQTREVLSPLFSIKRPLLQGKWSPDSRWWFFRSMVDDEKATRLHFYDAFEKKICTVDKTSTYDIYLDRLPGAWLPGNQLLLLDGSAEVSIIEPCGSKTGQIKAVDGITLSQVTETDPTGGRVLLQSQDSYWILQPGAKDLQPIPGVQPTPYEAHWDNAAWGPGGERLAIAHLNSREPRDGITLYLIDGEKVEVTFSQVMNLASKQSAPFIEWITNDELLLNGPNSLILMDFRTNPPSQKNVIRDIFNLGLKYPDQVSSMASITARDGSGYHLMIWANHPRNKGLYIYHSENGKLTVYQAHNPALLIFPDGQWTRMSQLEGANQSKDTIELYWVDSDQSGPVTIQVDGHLPRGYPRLDISYLPDHSRLLLASSNGVSLVGIPDGELIHFWKTGSGLDIAPWLNISPDGKTALITVEGDGLFQIPIDR